MSPDNHPPVRRPRRILTEVRIENFKSVLQRKVTLHPLSVVVGANSSGKSTLLQSIMTLAQAAQAANSNDSFPLNGDLTDLGYFDQVRHMSAPKTDSVAIGATLSFIPSAHSNRYLGMTSGLPGSASARIFDEPWEVSYDVRFKGADVDDPVSAKIQEIRLAACPPDPSQSVNLKVARVGGAALKLDAGDLLSRGRVRLDGPLHTRLRGTLTHAGVETTIAGVGLRGGIPTYLATKANTRRALAQELLGLFVSGPYFLGAELAEDPEDELSFDVQPYNRQKMDGFIAHAVEILSDWQDGKRDRNLYPYIRNRLDASLLTTISQSEVAAHQSRLVESISRRLRPAGQTHVVVSGPAFSLMQVATSGLHGALGEVRHLGGLRIGPQPLYPTSSAAQQGEIGRSGQFTASVLYSLRHRPVNSFDEHGQPEASTLQVAVAKWANRLGLFTDVEPHHQGALGIDIQVAQPGLDRGLDITAVGLGVSQMLPVLLRCLLSDPDDLILLEQPELHLHPASQQRLADFLLACSMSGRQIIVETHSEHLINRLRFRAASDESDFVSELVGLVFAARDDVAGETTYRNVGLNPFGGLTEWPDRFLAEGISDAQRILDEGLAKLTRRGGAADVSI